MNLFRTSPSNYVSLILRLTTGILFTAHGLQKLGVISGGSIDGTLGFMSSLGVPAAAAWLVIIAEAVGGLGLILGFLTRFAAAALILVMLGATFLVHLPNGFFAPGGFELPFVLIGSLLPLVFKGGGMWSIDAMIAKN